MNVLSRIFCLALAISLFPPHRAWAQAARGWPIWHGDASLSGLAPTEVPDKPVRLWRYNAGSPVSATPVSAEQKVFFTTQAGRIGGIDSAEGKEIWSIAQIAITNQQGAATETFDAPPLLVSNALVLASSSGTLYSFNAATGQTNWTYQAGERIQGTPNWFASPGTGGVRVVVICQPSGTLHGVDLRSGQGIWRTPPTARCDGSLAVADNRIVFGNCNAALQAHSTEDGRSLLNVPAGPDSQIAGGVALDGALAFSGSRSGQMICADMAKGQIVWTSRPGMAEIFTTPAVNAEVAVFGSRDGMVYCLDRKSGQPKWKVQPGGTPSSPVIAGKKVVVAADGTLHILNLADGTTLWSQKIADEITSPAIVQGRIIVGSQDGYVTAFGEK